MSTLDSEKHTSERTRSIASLEDEKSLWQDMEVKANLNDAAAASDAENHTETEDSDDDDEFGGAGEDEVADLKFLQEIKNDYRDEMEMSTPTLFYVASSSSHSTNSRKLKRQPKQQQQQQQHQQTNSRRYASRPALRRSGQQSDDDGSDDKISSDSDDDGDEFVQASVRDRPRLSFLSESRRNLLMSDSGVPPQPRVRRQITPSQLQAHIPAALDNEKHEEIGHLMDSRHSRGIDSKRSTRTALSWDADGEFGDAALEDTPDVAYLQDAKVMIQLEDEKSVDQITPSQLQARIPAGLDNEKHEDIGDLIGCSYPEENDFEDFEDASLHDEGNRCFLYDSTHTRPLSDTNHSMDADAEGDEHLQGSDEFDFSNSKNFAGAASNRDKTEESSVEYDHLNDETFDARAFYQKSNLDRDRHDDLATLRKSRTSMTSSLSSIIDDEDEFCQADTDASPVKMYLEEGKAYVAHDDVISKIQEYSENAFDEMDDDIEFEDLKDTEKLDSEKHEDLDTLRKSRSLSAQNNDEKEFGSASELDVPNPRYLMSEQLSENGDEPLVQKHQLSSDGLDGEAHEDLDTLRAVGLRSLSDDEFCSASSLEVPSSAFLLNQLSGSLRDEEIDSVIAEEDIKGS